MKKRNLKSFQLNKTSISNLEKIRGGAPNDDCTCDCCTCKSDCCSTDNNH